MARISSADTLAALKSDNPPPLVFIGSSRSTVGRINTMMKIRPSVLKRIQAVTMGPQYLILEHALIKLAEELEAMPKGTSRTIDAARFDPSPEDLAEVEALKKPSA